MKVFVILESTSYSDYEFCGVYATEKQAQARLNEIIEEVPRQKDNLYISGYEIMDKWEALKEQLEKIGRTQTVFAGHVLMMMDVLEKNPDWDLKRDGMKAEMFNDK